MKCPGAKWRNVHATQLTFNSLFGFGRMIDCDDNILFLHYLTMIHSKHLFYFYYRNNTKI